MDSGDELSTDQLVRVYLNAKRRIVDDGYAHELVWQHAAAREPVTPRRFVEEAAWVVLCTGMSEAVVRRRFLTLAKVFGDFDPRWVTENRPLIRGDALAVFGNTRKIDAIFGIAATVGGLGIDDLREVMREPEAFLLALPYIGPVTWRHLAKNLGAPVAKADRHLVRLADAVGRASVDDLCDEIADWIGDPVSVVDIVLWRWSVVHASACSSFCQELPDVNHVCARPSVRSNHRGPVSDVPSPGPARW